MALNLSEITRSVAHAAFVKDVDGRLYKIVVGDGVAVLSDLEQFIGPRTGNRGGRFFAVADMLC